MSEMVLPETLEQEPPERPADLFTRFIDVLAAVGTVWTFALMLLVVADVTGRDFFSRPIVGVAEMAGNSIVGIVFLQLASAVNSGRMTRADFLIEMLGSRRSPVVRGLEGVFSLLGAVAMAVLCRAGYPNLVGAYTKDEFFGVQGLFTIPTWPVHGLIVLGSALACIVYLRLAYRFFSGNGAPETRT